MSEETPKPDETQRREQLREVLETQGMSAIVSALEQRGFNPRVVEDYILFGRQELYTPSETNVDGYLTSEIGRSQEDVAFYELGIMREKAKMGKDKQEEKLLRIWSESERTELQGLESVRTSWRNGDCSSVADYFKRIQDDKLHDAAYCLGEVPEKPYDLQTEGLDIESYDEDSLMAKSIVRNCHRYIVSPKQIDFSMG